MKHRQLNLLLNLQKTLLLVCQDGFEGRSFLKTLIPGSQQKSVRLLSQFSVKAELQADKFGSGHRLAELA